MPRCLSWWNNYPSASTLHDGYKSVWVVHLHAYIFYWKGRAGQSRLRRWSSRFQFEERTYFWMHQQVNSHKVSTQWWFLCYFHRTNYEMRCGRSATAIWCKDMGFWSLIFNEQSNWGSSILQGWLLRLFSTYRTCPMRLFVIIRWMLPSLIYIR